MTIMERVESGLFVPRGHGTVELFKRGKLVERIEFENFLSADTLSYQRYMARKMFWTGMAGTTSPREGSSTTDSGAGANASTNEGPNRPEYWRAGGVTADWAPWWPMQEIMATTDDVAEAPATEQVLRGDIVAWSNRTSYVGADAKRGTPNVAECSASPLLTKWVFDWPTTAGNGTFQSVAWGRLASGDTPNSARNVMGWHGDAGTSTTTANTIRQSTLRITWDTGNDRLLVYGHTYGGTGGMFAVPKGGGTGTAVLLFSAPSGAHAPGSASSAIAYDGTGTPGVWMTHSSGSWLRKYALDGTLITSATRTSSPLDSGAQARSLAFDGTDIWAVSNNVDKAYRISATTGEVLSSFAPGTGAKTINWFPALGFVGVVGFNNLLYLFDAAGVAQGRMSPAMAQNQAASYQQDDTCGRTEPANSTSPAQSELVNSQIYTNADRTNYGTRFNRYSFNSLGARTRLASPVTKDSTKTMKITYQFDFV